MNVREQSADATRPAGWIATVDRYRRLLLAVLWIAVGVVVVYHAVLHARSLVLTQPMGFWETIYVSIANVWPQQYQWEHHVEGHDGYGPGYPAFVRPFLLPGVDVYVAHRAANAVALGLTLVLMWRLVRRRGCGIAAAAALGAIFYALNAGSYSIQARPDFLVLLLIAAMLVVGEAAVEGRLKPGVGVGVVLGGLTLAAFFTKGYAGFTWATIIVHLAVFVDFRRAVVTAAVSGAILGGGVVWFALTNPLYVLEIFAGPPIQKATSFEWLVGQTGDFALLTCGVLALALLPLAGWWRRGAVGMKLRERLRRVGTGVEGYWRVQALLATAALLGAFGWHAGAYLTYYLHLLLVPLIVLAAVAAGRSGTVAIGVVALAANLIVLMLTAPEWPREDPEWEALRRDVLNERGRVAVDFLMEPIARERPGTILVSYGRTGYVLREPYKMPDTTETVRRARASADMFTRRQFAEVFGKAPADVLYLDCVVMADPSRPGKSVAISRNEIPHFQGAEMLNYTIARAWSVRPYYFATNVQRQEAGRPSTTIVKFVRKKTAP